MEKHGSAREAVDDNIVRHMRFECCITKQEYRHILTIFNTYCFLTATMVKLFYLHCLYCYNTVLKIKPKLHMASGSTRPNEKFFEHTCLSLINYGDNSTYANRNTWPVHRTATYSPICLHTPCHENLICNKPQRFP